MTYRKDKHGYDIEAKSPSDVQLIEMFMAMLNTKDLQPYIAIALEQVCEESTAKYELLKHIAKN